MSEDLQTAIRVLQNSSKGKLEYHNGWDERPHAITALITSVQEEEIDRPNRKVLENAMRTFSPDGYTSSAPKPRRGRHSFPENFQSHSTNDSLYPSVTSSFIKLKIEQHDEKTSSEVRRRMPRSFAAALANHKRFSEPPVDVEDSNADEPTSDFLRGRILLTPPNSRPTRRKKSIEGSPLFKPSPTFSSSTLTQTHSSTTSDATSATPTRNPVQGHGRISNRLGIRDSPYDEELLEEELYRESRNNSYDYISQAVATSSYKEDVAEQVQKVRTAFRKMQENFFAADKEGERLAKEKIKADLEAQRLKAAALKKQFQEKDAANLQESKINQQTRLKQEERQQHERKLAADAAERNRKAIQEAAERQEQIRIQKIQEEQKRREEAEAQLANQEKERQKKAAEEEKRLAEAKAAAASAAAAATEQQKKEEEKPISNLILQEDLLKFTRTNELLKQFEDPVSHIDGKDPASKAFYIGAVKSINTPLNALADTSESEILKKVEHFSKLLSGEPVSGGGSMSTLFSCKSIQNGELFVMKTLAFRFVKKSEADVTRGKSTVQPLATVGVHICRKFPMWASLVQANMYKLCPFLVPFSYPQGDLSIQAYAKELGHELSGSETAIQQTFLERLKGYCTLYALMVLKIHRDGPLEAGDAAEFFSLGGAWQVIAKTMKLEPQVDVTATVIHTLLDILDDTLYATYKNQFVKLMRLLILTYLPKIKSVTPPSKSGSVSRLQIYLEKKYSV